MSWAPEISPKQKVMGKLEGKVATSLPMDIAFDLPGRFPIARRWAPIPLRLIVGFGFMEHGFAKLVQGPRRIRRYSARASRACTTFHGVVYHTDRNARRSSSNSWRFRDSCQLTDGCASVSGYLYCASALRV